MKASDLLFSIGRPVAYYPSLAKPLGGVNACLFFCQIFYWQDKTDCDLGVYKTAEDITNETGLSYKEQATARKILVDKGILIETHKRLDHKIFYKINISNLDSAISSIVNPRNADQGVREDPKCNFDLSTETTTETTIENNNVSLPEKQANITDVFDYWKLVMSSQRSKLDSKRKKLINDRLKTYSVDDLKTAIHGCSVSPFHMGENDRGVKYNSIELILRDSSKIDQFIGYSESPPKAGGSASNFDFDDVSWVKDFGDTL